MKRCPKCKKIMNRDLVYNNGNPIISFKCNYCGYDEGKLYTGQQDSKMHFLRRMKK